MWRRGLPRLFVNRDGRGKPRLHTTFISPILLYNQKHGGNSSTGRAPDCGSDGCGFDSRFPPQFLLLNFSDIDSVRRQDQLAGFAGLCAGGQQRRYFSFGDSVLRQIKCNLLR